MKNIFTLLIITLLISCKQTTTKEISEKESFAISGVINGEYSGFIYLNYKGYKDSVKVINNHFEFKGGIDKPRQGWLNLKFPSRPAWIYVENSTIDVNGDFELITQGKEFINTLNIKNITGSKSAEIIKDYQNFYQKNYTKKNFRSLLFTKLDIYIEQNKSHPFSGVVLGELALINPVLSKKELNQLYAKIDTTTQNKEDLEMFKMGIAKFDKYRVGKPFLKFKLPNTDDKKIDITSYLGKITLVDFWASWCGPCRAKHPDLIKLKNKFKNANFDILSISIDNNKENWLKAIEKDNLFWTNLLDLEKEVNNKLGIQGIPFNYLIDEKGFVLGINLPIEQIERILKGKVSR